MYRVNSISKQLVSFQVVEGGKLRAVNLLPGNFVFTEKVTSQIQNLVENKVIRVHAIAKKPLPAKAAPSASTSVSAASTAASEAKTKTTTIKNLSEKGSK